MRLDVRRFLGAAIGAGALGVGAVAATVLVSGSSANSAVQPVTSPSASMPASNPEQPAMADFADFRALQARPAAAAPIRRLPRVRLATVTVAGIPPVPLTAYRQAARAEASVEPGCKVPWWLLAGIGFVESGHAHSGGSDHVGWSGVARPPIFGPVLDGSHGFKAIRDTDGGRLDADRRWDRAVGPMQFLPSTWMRWGPSGRIDGHANPQDIFAAAKATAGYLCAGGTDISQPHPMALAVYSYNHSFDYVRLVLSVGARYAGMTPDQLGVNLLPKDQPAGKHHKKHGARSRHRGAAARGTHRAATSPSPTASPTASPSPSPSASPSPSSNPLPLPTLSPFGIH